MDTYRALCACPACHVRTGRVISSRDGKTGQPLVVLQCQGCGLGRIDPMPTASALQSWYAQRFRLAHLAAVPPAPVQLLRDARAACERWEWAHLQGAPLPARLLDVGTRQGAFVFLAQSIGVAATGLEPDHGQAAFARNQLTLNVLTGSLMHRLPELPAGRFDRVTLFQVLEHLPDPVRALRSLAGLLAPGGLLHLDVPDAAAPVAAEAVFFRAHTLYFTASTLRAVVQAAGWEVVASDASGSHVLRLLLRPLPAATDAGVNAQWLPTDALHRAQLARSGLAAWWQRRHWRKPGAAWQQHLARLEERKTAAQFSSPRALLEAAVAVQVARYKPLWAAAMAARDLQAEGLGA